MLHVAESIIIERPQDLVFDTAANPETQLHWDPSTLQQVEKLTPGPLGQGARYRGKFKGLGTLEYEFAEYDQPRRFVHQTVIPLSEMHHVFTFEQVPGGTRLTQEARLEPNLLGRIMSPVMSMVMRKRFRTIGSELRQYLAAASASPETSQAQHSSHGNGAHHDHGGVPFDLRQLELPLKLRAPLLAWVIGRQHQRDLGRLKRLLEDVPLWG